MKKISIAIDGYSSCGKSTLAKQLAKQLGYIYVDTGAMYRAVTLFAMQNNFINDGEVNTEHLVESLPEISIHFELNEENHPVTHLNKKNVEAEIRTMEVSNNVSKVSTIKEVRQKLVYLQQQMGAKGGVVMDGRDIGTVVMPEAELKIFMTADNNVRAKRRWLELKEKGQEETIESVLENLKHRDNIDSTRAESPLTQANDALVLDNTNLSRDEQLKLVLKWVKERTSA